MVTCPRCHFVQPKDRYCAQCGVDMTTFKVKEPSLLNRLSSSAALYLALGIFVFGFTLYFFAFEAKLERGSVVIERIERSIPGNRLPPQTTQDLAATEDPAEVEASSLTDATPKQDPIGSTASVPSVGRSPTPRAGQPSAALAPSAARPSPTTPFPPIRILFIEGSTEIFPGGSGTIAKEDIYERNGRDLSDSKFLLLVEKRWREIHPRKVISDSYWTQDARLGVDNPRIGLDVSIVPQEFSNSRLRLQVYFNLQWPEPHASQVQLQKTGSEFTIRTLKTPPFSVDISPMTVFFYGLPLPHRTFNARDGNYRDLLSQNPILKLMTSPRFQVQPPQSDFFVLFETLDGP